MFEQTEKVKEKEEQKEVRLLRLEVENILKAKAVEIDFDEEDSSVVLAGKNGQGKSSILQALGLLLGLEKRGDPINNEATEGKIRADFGKFVIERTYKNGRSTLWRVVSKDGTRYSTAKELLDNFINYITFQPQKFISLGKPERIRTLSQHLDIDMDKIEKDKEFLKNERTEVGREAKKLKGYLESLPVPDEDLPEEEQSLDSISDKIQDMEEFKETYDEKLRGKELIENTISSYRQQVNDKENRIKELTIFKDDNELEVTKLNTTLESYPDNTREIEAVKEQIASLQAKLTTLETQQEERNKILGSQQVHVHDIEDALNEISEISEFISHINEEITSNETSLEESKIWLENNAEKANVPERLKEEYEIINQTNRAIRDKKEYQKAKALWEEAARSYNDYTNDLQEIQDNLKDKLQNADLVDGIEIDGNEIKVNGIPFDDLSSMEQLDLSMKIGMQIRSKNPNGEFCKIVTLDISQYDDDNRRLVPELAKKYGFQAILEVATTNPVNDAPTFLIEEGKSTKIQ
jgi:DNA repair exonuclease SbcCD ATPase subunit